MGIFIYRRRLSSVRQFVSVTAIVSSCVPISLVERVLKSHPFKFACAAYINAIFSW